MKAIFALITGMLPALCATAQYSPVFDSALRYNTPSRSFETAIHERAQLTQTDTGEGGEANAFPVSPESLAEDSGAIRAVKLML